MQELTDPYALGKSYNKDEYLLDKAAYGDGGEYPVAEAPILRLSRPSHHRVTPKRPQPVCPLTMKELNGAQPFVCLFACGSQAGEDRLRLVYSKRPGERQRQNKSVYAELELCPQCGRSDDVVPLNPSQDEENAMREAMERKRLFEPVKRSKSSRKRKNGSPTDHADHPAKKQVAVGLSMKISAASQAVVSGLAMEAKRKSEMTML